MFDYTETTFTHNCITNDPITMRTKKTKLTKKEQELKHAYAVLKKYKIAYVEIDNQEFHEEWIFEQWEHCGIKPTAENVERAKWITHDYLMSQYWETMQDAIESLSVKLQVPKK